MHRQEIDFRLGHAIQLQDGKDITLVSTGGVLGTAIEVAQGLGSKGYSVRLLSMPTLAPLDTEAIRRAAMETNGILTIEAHSIDGLGTMTAGGPGGNDNKGSVSCDASWVQTSEGGWLADAIAGGTGT